MAVGKSAGILFVLVALTSASSSSYASHEEGRKLFGGYRIIPKTCQPTTPSKIKSDQPAVCMFNYECTRRKGEVVGTCMDGFLFGACCQLPSTQSPEQSFDKFTDDLLNAHEVDHVPEIPILLNPDGTPVSMSIPQGGNTIKTQTLAPTGNVGEEGIVYTKVSTFDPSSSTAKPSPGLYSHMSDVKHNAEKPQVPQADISHLEENFPNLLGQQEILDDLSLPGLLTQSDSNNDIQDHHDIDNPVTTLLSPDQVLQIADPVDQLPALFSQGLGQSNHSSADTVLLNENGSLLNESHNPDEVFRPGTVSPSHSVIYEKVTQKVIPMSTVLVENKNEVTQTSSGSPQSSTTQWIRFPEHPTSLTENRPSIPPTQKLTTPMAKKPVVTQMYANTQRLTSMAPNILEMMSTRGQAFEKVTLVENKVSTNDNKLSNSGEKEATTPMSVLSTKSKEDMVKIPTITYENQSGNKKNDLLDKEEIAINHIISILNNTTPGSELPTSVNGGPTSSIHTWVSIDETSKPTANKIMTPKPSTTTESFPYTFYKPAQSSAYYNYNTASTGSNSFSSYATSNAYTPKPSTQMTYGSSSSFGYSSKPTTNPPAPTVIVLGPLGTEFTTDTTQKTVSRVPVSTRVTTTTSKPIPVRTKNPSVSTTITHNISTVISGGANTNNNLVSTSYISVNLKDEASTKPTAIADSTTESIVASAAPQTVASTKKPTVWTTISTWSSKPTFQLKPSKPSSNWPGDNLTPVDTVESSTIKTVSTTPNCDKETGALSDLANFPPVRNPNITHSTPVNQQEKPTIVEIFNNTGYPDINEDNIPTPVFIEDNELTNKVDTFVNKIVQSLQGNFQDLKNVVYNRKNATTLTTPTVTRKPVIVSSTTSKPVGKPSTTTRPQRPNSTKKPTIRPTPRPTRPSATLKPKPTSQAVNRPSITTAKPSINTAKPSVNTGKPLLSTTKRPKPTKKPVATTVTKLPTTTTPTPQTNSFVNATAATTPYPDFRTQCGVRPLVRSSRIVGGKGATFGKWPWQVLIREATWLGWVTKNKCGGVLITNKYVITAAHCQPGFLASLIAVFGEFDISTDLEPKRIMTKNVRRIIVHRGYNPTTFENDLALLELESPVQFDEHIVPICMPDDHADFTGRMATVTGWGKLKYDGGVPSVLQEVHVPIMENSVCQEMFRTVGHPKLIVDGFMCAGYANGQKDSCEGDSGGPLVMQRPDGRWILVGTVSHGIQCAAPYLPGVYMRMTHYKPWLHSVTGV